MARVKSGFRKRFNIRYWRWLAARATIGRISLLRRRFSFYPRGVDPEIAATLVIEDRKAEMATSFTPEECAFVRDRCWPYDTLAREWRGGVTVPVQELALTISPAELLGHVSRVFAPDREGVVIRDVEWVNWNFARAKRLRVLPALAGRCHLLARTDNYYHALFEDLVPVVNYLERFHPKGMPLTLLLPPSRLESLNLGCALLEQAYPGVRVIAMPDDAKVAVEEALWLSFDAGNAEWSFADAAPVQRLADLFRAHYGVPAGRGRRIFFSRGNSKIRRLLNEDALWDIARGHGFERFEAKGDNHAEQVRLFSQADAVIGVHGAGLGNLAFCRPGTQVIELFPANFTKSTYLWLSRRLGLDYGWLIGEPGDYDQAFALNENLLRDKLQSLPPSS
ncbi:hypothetical protein C5L14_23965 [Labrys okinawensis]|uniref:Glycosyltransferase 61 catalytic domain-containing protein n=1 Tax=Labrys okinawensis TaxID=346911 RepID=A0A2S9Q6L6_9HYPH|nr:glycosyltransferase family 61 protein [Labrys okinawensis]PRH85008.1 hypothetical protein C5L14_23965 [Labrys okinawensis]